MSDLLATAPTLALLHGSVTRFYCGMETRLEPAAPNRWNVIRESDGKHLDGVTVLQKGKRFRFEMVAP